MQKVTMELTELPYDVNEELKLLRTNLQFCGANRRAILVTSCVSEEGKSTAVFNLARSFADLGMRVLLIDADLRKSVLKDKIASGEAPFGLSHYLSGQNEADDVITQTENDLLDIVFCGTYPPNPSELLADPAMEEFLKAARKVYDYILIDTAPLGMVVDAAVLAPLCDGGVILVKAGEIHRAMAQDVISQLKRTGCPILGVVLNQVERKGSGHYGKYYGRNKKYGKYYGQYGNEESKNKK